MIWKEVSKDKPVCNYECTETGIDISLTVLVSDGGTQDVGHVNEEGKWTVYNEFGYLLAKDVTHWMPLPENPK